MTASPTFTKRRPSPHQIRKQAAAAFRRRMRQAAPTMRPPEADETPLSRAEVALGVRLGLINTARVRAFAEP